MLSALVCVKSTARFRSNLEVFFEKNNKNLRIFAAPGVVPTTPALSQEPIQESLTTDTPRRRSSRSRTKSPEPIKTTIATIQDPTLAVVPEEAEEPVQAEAQKTELTDPQMYEKIIDEMEVDEENAQDVNEDELLAEEPDEVTPVESEHQAEQPSLPEKETQPEAKPATDDESRGTKRRSDSPSKGNTPKKRQRLPPPNIEDFVNDEDEPELDENSLQLSWCKLR